ncbi:F-box protein At3g07870-like [Cornus florida]|uniref:F-box protein At3g07870-like n=1 Tax=Cornus florida TaxID=4283 RepID=UPI00289C356F|nr:F-box protein At3g07870-like [Cornus florida]
MCSPTSSLDYPSKPSSGALVSANHGALWSQTLHLKRSSLANNNHQMFDDYTVADKLPRNGHGEDNFRIIGCCNGVLCLSDDLHYYQEKLYLWNPSIQNLMTLPPLRVTFQTHGALFHSIGFGFDSPTNDYKVVRIVYADLLPDIRFRTLPEVDIFSLSTGTWRNITHLGPPHTIYDRSPQAYLKGAAHWLAYDRKSMNNLQHLIVSFHMGDEEFGEIMAPGCIFYDKGGNVRVAEFRESLSLIVGRWDKGTCCIWVMKEYGMSESWTNLFNIDVSGESINCLVGFTGKGGVLSGTRFGYLVAYDPEIKLATHIPILGSTTDVDVHGDAFDLYTYTENLVLLGSKFRDKVTCEESSVSSGEVSGAKKSRKIRVKPEKRRKKRRGA